MNKMRTQTVALNKGKTIVGRILPGTDLISGIERICQDHHVNYGTIVAAIGSLSRAGFVYALPDKSAKMGIKYSDPTTVEGPLELLACQGMIGLTVEGDLSIHLHGLMSDSDMKVYGCHFLKNANPVLVTVEILIHEHEGVRMVREQDIETDFPLFKFYEALK
jgi:predicted DNA-binding protein with PD1-like motif